MQAAVDGAALAAANADMRTDKQREALARAYYLRNFDGASDPGSRFSVKVTPAKVTARAGAEVSTPFMSLGGLTSVTIVTEGEVLRVKARRTSNSPWCSIIRAR